jgi:DNA end-binding protein Ku
VKWPATGQGIVIAAAGERSRKRIRLPRVSEFLEEAAMAARPIWRGHLRLALVTCPIALHNAERSSGSLNFHLINPKTGSRVRMVTLDAGTDEEISRRDLVKGYEFEKDRYVLMEDEDFEKARIESSSTLTVDKFVDLDSIDPLYFDSCYYMVPDGDAGQDVYVVLHDAIAQSKRAALSRLVMARRERAVAIRPMGKGLVLHTLREPRDLYSAEDLFDGIPEEKPDPEMVKLATQLIDRQAAKFEPADTEDRYETRLREVIAAKLQGEGITPNAPAAPRGDNVIDLMAALKRSLGQEATGKNGSQDSPHEPAPADKPAAKRRTATRKRA